MTQKEEQNPTLPQSIRAVFLDVIVIWLFISFFRLFVAENYRIPTSSMTPTLVGGKIAELDYDGDGLQDYILSIANRYETFTNLGNTFHMSFRPLPPSLCARVDREARVRHDHILVSKFAYWFRRPERGDIAVFKTPRAKYTREAPMYVKRIVGLPDETITIENGRLHVDGRPADSIDFFKHQYYDRRIVTPPGVFNGLTLANDEYLFFGDNTLNSSDGREWGPLPQENIKGKVFFRYWPWQHFGPIN